MNLAGIKNLVTSKVGRQILHVQNNSPHILFAAGVVGIVGTVVLASRATLKLDKVLDEHENKRHDAQIALERPDLDYSATDHRRDMVILHTKFLVDLTKLYAPAIVLGLASIAALTGSHVVLNRRYLGVTAAYAAIEKGFQEYRRRVVEEYGEEKDLQFRHDLVDKEIFDDSEDGGVVRTIKALGEAKSSIYSFFFDESSSNWSRERAYNQMFLKCQEQYANDLLRSRGHLFLNEVHDMLGVPRTRAGAVVGWVLGCGDSYVDFGIFRDNQYMAQEFVNGNERSVLIDPNVDGIIWDKIEEDCR